MAIATVLSITGQAWARDADGNLRELSVGDTLVEGETLVTSDNGSVQLDFLDGLDPTTISGGQEIAMTPDVDVNAPVDVTDSEVLDADLEALLAAIDDDDVDLLDVLDPTAAGAGGGAAADGGHGFVRLARITEGVDPLAFEFGSVQTTEFTTPEGEAAPVDVGGQAQVEGNPTADDASLSFAENALLLGGGGGFNSLTEEGTLDFDFGLLGPGSIGFASMDGQTLTIGQESVTFSWDSATNTLTASNERIQASNPDEPFLLQLVIDPQTGAFTITLANNLLHTEGSDEALANLVYTVTDAAGNSVNGNLIVTIVDDVPGLDLSAVDLSEVSFETLDSETVDGTSVASASVAAAFTAAVDASYGADGAGSTVISDYALTLGDLDHGLTSGGEPVVFTQDASGVITGTADGTEVLRIEIGADGTVTVTQSAALDHDAQGADSLTLPAGLVGVEATVTVTDGDGDTVSDTLSTDLSGNISIVDDVPGLDLSDVDLSEVSFETLDSETVDGTSVASASVAAAFTAAVDASYGADGAGSTVISDYALTLGDLDHGLTSGGEPLTFSLDGGVITGSTPDGEVLRIEIGSDGTVTVTQSAPLDHDAQGADSLTLPAGLVGVEATVTVTDGDGDTVSDTLSTDLSGNISIVDDVPGL
ncbi:retention module-containing protein, partial [Halomonas salipaludis]